MTEAGGARRVIDKYGLCLEGEHLVLFIPATGKALVFRVKCRRNRGYERINYGPLPLKSGELIDSFEGGTVAVPEDGVMPPRSYTSKGRTFPALPTTPSVYDTSDMWYVKEEYRDVLFHVHHDIQPKFLRVDCQIPPGISLAAFQRARQTLDIATDWGWGRGKYEIVHIPTVRVGWRWGNDTNLPLFTRVVFTYAEYEVEIPKDASFIFDILTRKVPAHWITLPFNFSLPDDVRTALIEVYGHDGFSMYPITRREEAIKDYGTVLAKAKI